MLKMPYVNTRHVRGDLVVVRVALQRLLQLGIIVKTDHDQLNTNIYWVWLNSVVVGPLFASELQRVNA
jgi:hypothetical protein